MMPPASRAMFPTGLAGSPTVPPLPVLQPPVTGKMLFPAAATQVLRCLLF